MKQPGRRKVRFAAACLGSLLPACAPSHAAPFAASVVEYTPGTGLPIDSLTGQPFNNPVAALGPPTVDTTGDGFLISPLAPLPVTPVYPAFRSVELVSIGHGGRLTVSFDAPVLDDPANPFGLDFIVFGNAWQSVPGASGYGTNDPGNIVLGPTLVNEPGLVSVSADGSNWFSFAEGPFADAFAPKLGRRFSPDSPDPSLGDWNLWWGEPSDPTFPVDPSLSSTDLASQSLAFAARAYLGSAGGAGFDIGGFALPPDSATGLKFIRYVRIENLSATWTPEIDALADVAPVSAWRRWQLDRFPWRDRMDPANLEPHADPDGDGVVNLFEHAADTEPLIADAQPLFTASILPRDEGDLMIIEYRAREQAADVLLGVEYSGDLQFWTPGGVIQEFLPPRAEAGWVHHTAAAPAGACGAVRLRAELIWP